MARRRPSARPQPEPPSQLPKDESPQQPFWTRGRLGLAVVALLTVHWALATLSLVRENPTIDEVVHLPAGISYWQTGTFRLYPHNPPLFKLIAALPLLASEGLVTEPLYRSIYWRGEPPNKTGFAHEFANLNAGLYFELFTRSRLLMPIFSVIGGVLVFAWSRRLYGPWGGLLSLWLWCLCPNVLAHARLITSDAAATAIGFGATFAFVLYLHRPTWTRAAIAGVALGLAQLTKFSLLLLYGLWPVLWLFHEVFHSDVSGRVRRLGRALLHGILVVILSLFVINIGYGFEKVGEPLGKLPFVSGTLTRLRSTRAFRQPRPTELLDRIREYRVNRFQGTRLGAVPVPLPRYYLTGFDEQKLEADGVWRRFLVSPEVGDRMGPEGEILHGYPVYLNGVLRDESWSSYYLWALIYKVPEGTGLLILGSFVALATMKRSRASWGDEIEVLTVPVAVLAIMSTATNINLGLRYVLPTFPYLFASAGKLAPWVLGLRGTRRAVATVGIAACLAATGSATAIIHPHHLAYFNWTSGGPARGSEHLIDSNLDWGQDLVGLEAWIRANVPANEPIGIAYFGQVDPNLFARRGRPLNWFLPPAQPGTMWLRPASQVRDGEVLPPRPGLYAVSASLLRGLDWRVYSPPERSYWDEERRALIPVLGPEPRGYWPAGRGAFSYFQTLKPIGRHVGHSILLYRVTPEDARRLGREWRALAARLRTERELSALPIARAGRAR